jgi:hypothetical protein
VVTIEIPILLSFKSFTAENPYPTPPVGYEMANEYVTLREKVFSTISTYKQFLLRSTPQSQ